MQTHQDLEYVDEKTPLIPKQVAQNKNNDAFIQIEATSEMGLGHLSQDLFNEISYYLSYKKELSILAKTSKKINELVKNTPAGKWAQKVNHFEPNLLRAALADHTIDNRLRGRNFFSAIGSVIGSFGGGSIGFFGMRSIVASGFGSAIGTGLGIVGGMVLHWGLFKNKENVNAARKERENIQEILNKPCITSPKF